MEQNSSNANTNKSLIICNNYDKKLIKYFRYIVEMYIKTGEPVGSKRLVEKFKLSCSSATIRNAMAELEKLGLLEKNMFQEEEFLLQKVLNTIQKFTL